MKESIVRFRDKIKKLADDAGLMFEDRRLSQGRITISFTPVFPLWLNIDIDEEENAAFIYASVRAHGILGDKLTTMTYYQEFLLYACDCRM